MYVSSVTTFAAATVQSTDLRCDTIECMKTSSKPAIVTICASAAFYRQVVDIQEQLQKQGVSVVIPELAKRMKETGDYEVSHYKTWYEDEGDYHKKAALMHGHFDKVAAGDAILVVNLEKNGKKDYIGANVLMEMALAFHLRKPIFVLNALPPDSPFEEELKGMTPVLLGGRAEKIADYL